MFADADTEVVSSPPRAPKANAYAERWVSTVGRECLDRTLIVNQRHLVRVLTDYEKHDNAHRPHRALTQLSPDADLTISDNRDGAVQRKELLGGLINEYRHTAYQRPRQPGRSS